MTDRIAIFQRDENAPSHLWMRRMRRELGDRVSMVIDEATKQRPGSAKRDSSGDEVWIPRKRGLAGRFLSRIGMSTLTKETFKNQFLLERLRESKPNVLLVHFLTVAVSYRDVWKSIDTPVVVHCHGFDVTWNMRTLDGNQAVHDPSYVDHIRKMPENVSYIANSTHTRDQLLQIGVSPERIFVKHFGVAARSEPRPFNPSQHANVLFLGRLIGCKGPSETVEAFHRGLGGTPNACLEIAGDGPEREAVERRIEQLGVAAQVRMHGVVAPERGQQLRQNAAIFTAHNQLGPKTFQQEAFGVSLLEAMADGLPVVTGRSGGIVDMIESGRSGVLFEPGDLQTHADILQELAASPQRRHEIGTAAWETVRDRFRPEQETERLLAIFAAATGQTQHRPSQPNPIAA